MNCGLKEKRSKRFLDRDENAARNIFWIGLSEERPLCLSRQQIFNKSQNNPPVGSGGPLSDPN